MSEPGRYNIRIGDGLLAAAIEADRAAVGVNQSVYWRLLAVEHLTRSGKWPVQAEVPETEPSQGTEGLWYPPGEGWVEWGGGGECPVLGDAWVDVLSREERERQGYRAPPVRARCCAWHWDRDADSDIVAYRVVT